MLQEIFKTKKYTELHVYLGHPVEDTIHYPARSLNLVCVTTFYSFKTPVYLASPSTCGLLHRLFSKTCQLNFLYLPHFSDACCISHAAVLHFIALAAYHVQCKL